ATGLDEPALESLGEDPLAPEAAAVVSHLNDDTAGVMEGVERNRSGRWLAARRARVRRLDAVIHCVAHQVRQRVGDLLHQRLVELGILALDDEMDFLVELARDVVHDPLEAVEDTADLHHAKLQRALADLL